MLESTMNEDVESIKLAAEQRVQIEAKFGIPEATNSKIFAQNGWKLIKSEEPHL